MLYVYYCCMPERAYLFVYSVGIAHTNTKEVGGWEDYISELKKMFTINT